MGMSAGPSGDGEDTPMSDINTTPLVDVMLVLLIIFLIAVPIAIKTVKLEVPNVPFKPTTTKAENVILAVRPSSAGACEVYWGGTSRVNSNELLVRAAARFKAEADRLGPDVTDPNLFPEVHIRGDKATPYRCIGGVIAIMQRAGFIRVGFISEPKIAG
jgi:biopolymer transport protein ExbD